MYNPFKERLQRPERETEITKDEVENFIIDLETKTSEQIYQEYFR